MKGSIIHTCTEVRTVVAPADAQTSTAPQRHRFGPQQRQLTIGADAVNDIVLSDPAATVSAQHAVLLRYGASQDSALLRDLASRNGTFVGDARDAARRIEQHYFEGAARLFIGPFRLDVALSAEKDPWDRLSFGDLITTKPRRPGRLTALAESGAPDALPDELAGPNDAARRDLVRDAARWRRRAASRTTAMDQLVRRLCAALDAHQGMARLSEAGRRIVVPADAPPLVAPRGGFEAVADGNWLIDGGRMIVPLFDQEPGPSRPIGDLTLIRQRDRPAFEDRDAVFVQSLANWLLEGCMAEGATESDLPRVARAWPLPVVGVSDAHRELMAQVEEAARSRTRRVWISGPTGVGKTYVASLIHLLDEKSRGPFDVVNCGISDSVSVNAELFGMRDVNQSAFRTGKLQKCDNGTLLLDEVQALSRELQEALKAVTSDTASSIVRFTALADDQTRTGDVRIVCATTWDPEDPSTSNVFDPALLRRLRELIVRVPPLDARPQDIPLLALKLFDSLAAEANVPPAGMSVEAKQALMQQPWSENIAGLQKVLKAAFARACGRSARGDAIDDRPRRDMPGIGLASLPSSGRGSPVLSRDAAVSVRIEIDDLELPAALGPASDALPTVEEAQLDTVLKALRATKGDVDAAAKSVGVVPSTVYAILDNWCIARGYGGQPRELDDADRHEAQRLRQALELAAGESTLPGWNAPKHERVAFHARALAIARDFGCALSSVADLCRRLDALSVPRFHPGTTQAVRRARRCPES